MSLFGSAPSKPGGLSINTGAANLFGGNNASSQAPAASGLFGGTSVAKPPASNLFGSTAASSTPSAGTLFGAGTSNNPAATTAPSLFGGLSSTTNAPSAAGTLFGGAAATTNKPGGLFGSATTTTTSAPAAGGLFGSSLAPPAASTAGGGLFGAASMTSAAPASKPLFGSTTGGLFGSGAATGLGGTTGSLLGGGAAGNTGGGLFGSSTAATSAPAGGLFGAAPAAANPPPGQSLFGSTAAATQPTTTARPGLNHPAQPAPQQTQRSIFTSSIGQYTASQAAVPGVRVDATNLRPTTRFADLHELLQLELEKLDSLILKQHEYADECTQAMPAVADAMAYVPSDADFCRSKLDAVQSALEADAQAVDGLKRRTRACADDAKISFRNISALRTPAGYGAGGFGSGPGAGPVPAGLLDGDDVGSLQGRDLAAYMTRQVVDMHARLDRFRAGLSEVESYLQGVEAGTAARVHRAQARLASADGGVPVRARSADEQVAELAAVLRDFEGGILSVAGNIGAVREATQQVMLDDSRLGPGLRNLY